MNRREGNDNASPIQRSVILLNDLVSALKPLLDGFQTERCGLHIGYLSRFLVYTIRQVRAICILVGDPSQKYAEQAGQLLRGLYEIYCKAAWMMNPDDEQLCDRRAWCLEKTGIKKEPISDNKKQDLFETRGISEYETTSSPLKGLPTLKDMFSEIGRPDLYQIFQYESSAIHMSVTTLDTTVHSVDLVDSTVTLDGPDPPSSRAKRLLATRDVLCLTARVFIDGLGLDSQAWNKVEVAKTEEIVRLLSPSLSET